VVEPAESSGEKDSAERICWQCGETFSEDLEYCPEDGNQLVELDPSETKDILVGRVFDDRFRIVRKLGEGGMSRVYAARRLDDEGRVALKILKADFLRNPEVRKRFMYEARVISNLDHDNAVDLFDFGQAPDGSFYMVMELLEGESLAGRLDGGALSYREIFAVVAPVCEVLAEAHEQDVIHRDLKPENIFLTDEDRGVPTPELLDFGIAKHLRSRTMTKDDQLWGTPAYMSPEQASGDQVAGTADIYAMGVMLYELIAGVLPFRASTAMGFAVKHMHRDAPELVEVPGLESVPAPLEALVGEMLAKSPGDRPESMDFVADELREIRTEVFEERLLETVPSRETNYGELAAPSDEEISPEELPGETADETSPVTAEEGPSPLSRSDIEAGRGAETLEAPERGSAAETDAFETPMFQEDWADGSFSSGIRPLRIAVVVTSVAAVFGGLWLVGTGTSTTQLEGSTPDAIGPEQQAREELGAGEPSRVTSEAAGVAARVAVRAREVAASDGENRSAEPGSETKGTRSRPAGRGSGRGGSSRPGRRSGAREESERERGLSDEKAKEAVESTF